MAEILKNITAVETLLILEKGDTSFNDYEFNPYELHFKNILNSNSEGLKTVLFKKLLLKKFYAEFDWVEEIIKVSDIKKLFNENYFLKFWGVLPLNELGENELKNITETLNTSYNYTNPIDVFNTLTNLGSNIFHLRNFNTDDFMKINDLDLKSISFQSDNYLHHKHKKDSNYFNKEFIEQFDIKKWF